MKTRFLSLTATILLLGCAHDVELLEGEKAQLELVQNHYLEEAKKNAAFRASCDSKDAEVQILSETKSRVYLGHTRLKFPESRRIQTIGVKICKKKYVYRIICGSNDAYSAGSEEIRFHSKVTPCKVILEGAPEVVSAIEQVDTDVQAARNQAAEDARKKS